MSGYHVLPPDVFASMGDADPSSAATLLSGQASKRLVQLRLILDAVARHAPDAGRTAGLDASFDVLVGIQRDEPELVADLLASPQVGAWAASCLRQVVGGTSSIPLPVGLARLGAIAATAALRAGREVTVRVPVLDGVVSFPAHATATVDHAPAAAVLDCRTGASAVLLDGVPPSTWRPIPLLTTRHGGIELAVSLDDADPYWRTLRHPLSPPLSDASVAHWRRLLDEAGTVLSERHGGWLGTVAAVTRCLVPIEQTGTGGMSASSADAPGAVALTEPPNGERLSATLIHETQHSRLNLLHDLLPLFQSDGADLYYSPWRDDPRPPGGVLHGVYAFLGVAMYWAAERVGGRPSIRLEYARHLHQLRLGHRALQGIPELTPAGVAFVGEIGNAIGRLPPVPAEDADIDRVATDLATEHLVNWRLAHLRPDEADVAAAADAWLAGEPPATRADVPMRTRIPAAPKGDRPLTRLAMRWIDDTPKGRERAAGARHPYDLPETTTADLTLLAGGYDEAGAAYRRDIAAGEDAWAPLAVAAGRGGRTDSPLTTRPELVRAAWQRAVRQGGDGAALLTALAATEFAAG